MSAHGNKVGNPAARVNRQMWFGPKLHHKIWAFAVLWLVSGMTFFTSMDVPFIFLRALLLEALIMMVMLFIAASFLSWADRADRA